MSKNKIWKLLGILMICSLINSCGTKPASFSPNMYRHNYKYQYIVSADGDKVYCAEKRFKEFSSLHYTKIAELISILKVARVPRRFKKLKKKILENYTTLLKDISKPIKD